MGFWLAQLQKFFDVRARELRMCDDEFAINGYKALDQPSYWTEPIKKRLLDDIVTKLELSLEHHVLDVGCGTGMVLRQIAPHVAHVTGVDFSVDMLKIARHHLPPNAMLRQANAADLPFKDETFDRVLCYHVITNFPDDDFTLSVLTQLIRVTRKGGFVLIGNTPDSDKKDVQTQLILQQWRGTAYPAFRQPLLSRWEACLKNIWRCRMWRRSVQPALSNRFYTRDFFRKFAWQTFCEIEILPVDVEGYLYAPCRFDARLWPGGCHPIETR